MGVKKKYFRVLFLVADFNFEFLFYKNSKVFFIVENIRRIYGRHLRKDRTAA